jgi:hypothetical protein
MIFRPMTGRAVFGGTKAGVPSVSSST